MSISVQLRGVTRAFAGREALKGVTCSFGRGRINALIGPNGSGKTTLMRIVARLDALDAGAISYTDGKGAVQPGLPLMRRMTYVSQSPVLFGTTLYNNIAYGLKLRGMPPGDITDRVDEALKAGGLGGLGGAKAKTLSGGEAQRTALVRAYALRPELALLDEPTSSLDPEGVSLAEGLIRRMKETGTTVVMVTHNLFQARRLADSVFFMYGGRLVESGETREIFGTPKEELTGKFISGEVVC